MKINDLLSATKPILYETGSDEWPYAYTGTCFPVKYGKRLFIVSAIHCYENWKINPESTLYPSPSITNSFFAFDEQLKPTSTNIKEEKYKDQIVLSVASSHHDLPEINAVQALDLNLQGNCCSLTSPIIKDVWLRGFPLENPIHAINYEVV